MTVILKANKTPAHYGVASVPYEEGVADTWHCECNTQVVDMYKRVIVDLFRLGLDRNAPTFMGVSAGVLSIMALFFEFVEKETQFGLLMPSVFLVSGAWHPVVHPGFAASLRRFERGQVRCYVLNHALDRQCSWVEQRSYWERVQAEAQSAVRIVCLDNDGPSSCEMFSVDHHDLAGRLAASPNFWDVVMGQCPTG